MAAFQRSRSRSPPAAPTLREAMDAAVWEAIIDDVLRVDYEGDPEVIANKSRGGRKPYEGDPEVIAKKSRGGRKPTKAEQEEVCAVWTEKYVPVCSEGGGGRCLRSLGSTVAGSASR